MSKYNWRKHVNSLPIKYWIAPVPKTSGCGGCGGPTGCSSCQDGTCAYDPDHDPKDGCCGHCGDDT
jgi:hypothetical protein